MDVQGQEVSKVVMVSGSIPPEPCGVGDYTRYLCDCLVKRGVDVDFVRHSDLDLSSVYRQRGKEILHIQYPTMGYGRSLYPQLLSLVGKPSIVTLHEFSQVHPLRKFAELPFLFSANRLVFTTRFELDSVCKVYPEILKKSVVIPVAGAMLPAQRVEPFSARDGLVYFGLIRPKKGLEEFLEAARLVHHDFPSMPLRVFGAIPVGGEGYLAKLVHTASDLPIEWVINEPLAQVSSGLLRSKFAYLHFPDGLSERRSSYLAAIAHGVVVVSNAGSMTPLSFQNGFVSVDGPCDVPSVVHDIESRKNHPQLQSTALTIAEQFSWERITQLHLDLYAELSEELE